MGERQGCQGCQGEPEHPLHVRLWAFLQGPVQSHLMCAVREEVEVLKEQIKELIEKNSQLEQENTLLKSLASPKQLAQFQAQLQAGSPPATSQPPAQPASQGSGPSA
ncbi:TSC22 domain family protein 1-like [Monodelphis domestica]|uniref:TSC22 domain family protein 1 n=1 Tax=Monodelphis domestica TaxID=13616 RepID=A0A5F8HJR1_MONDO|nr:TSC22 domain family protein 1-like [Monodelphis domestica]